MITVIIFLFLAMIIVIEAVSLWGSRRPLRVSFEVDTTLVEPEETAVLNYTVSNPYRLPVLFVGLTMYMDTDISVREDGEFGRIHVSRNDTGTSVRHSFFLPAGSRFCGKIHISIGRRGLYEIGKYYLETGDFFGLYPVISSGPINKKIVCTSEKCAVDDLDIIGGELGEVSVRRFIFDDPTMLLGYRDYTGHEPMKQISWNQTEKTGRLMVRQNDFTTNRVAAVLVDMYSSLRPQLEECLKAVRTVCEQLEAAKIPYALMSNGDLLSVPEGIGREHLFFILRRLGLSRLAGFTSFERVVERCVRSRRVNCCYIVIAPAVTPETAALIDYLGSHADTRPVVMVPGGKEGLL